MPIISVRSTRSEAIRLNVYICTTWVKKCTFFKSMFSNALTICEIFAKYNNYLYSTCDFSHN